MGILNITTIYICSQYDLANYDSLNLTIKI